MSSSPASAEVPSTSWWPLAILILATLLVRGGILWVSAENLRQDPDGYRTIAHTLVTYGTYGYPSGDDRLAVPSAYRPPLYPIVLTKVVATSAASIWSVALLHLGLGLATVLVTWWIGRQWELGAWSYLAAVLVAIDPILLNQSTVVMTETLATFLAVVGLACLTRYVQSPSFWWAGLCGGALALAMLCRPTFAVWLALVAIPVTLTPEGWWRRIEAASGLILAAAIVLSPWLVRNALVMGRPIATTTHGGYTLWLGNRLEFYNHLARGGWNEPFSIESDSPNQALARQLRHRFKDPIARELTVDEMLMQDATDQIWRSPGMCAAASLYRMTRLWGLLPLQTDPQESTLRQLARYGVAAWYSVVLALAAFGLWSLGWKLWSSPWLWGVLLCLAFTLVHTVYWTDLRMRAPLTPMIALAAAFAVMTLAERWTTPAAAH